MSEVTQHKEPSMVRGLLDSVPTLRFDLERKNEAGEVEILPFRCRLLRPAQEIDVLASAQEFSKGKELEGYGDIYREAQAHEVLHRAIVHPEKVDFPNGTSGYRPYFMSAGQLRESLDSAECAQLFNCYELTKSHYRVNALDEKDVEALIDGLADEMTQTFFLKRVPSDDWPHLIYSLARLALSWRPAPVPTSSGSPNTSGSSPQKSAHGISTFSQLPAALSEEYGQLPTNKLLTEKLAAEIVAAAENDSKSEK